MVRIRTLMCEVKQIQGNRRGGRLRAGKDPEALEEALGVGIQDGLCPCPLPPPVRKTQDHFPVAQFAVVVLLPQAPKRRLARPGRAGGTPCVAECDRRPQELPRFSQGDGAMHGIDAALVRTVYRAGVPGHVIACEKQLRIGVVIGGFKFLKQCIMIDAHGQG